MNKTEAYYASSRCLFCHAAPCVQACPALIDIPLFIRQIKSGNMTGSARTIYDSNYFGRACGEICPTEVLCEGACVYTHESIKPIEIGRLQAYASNQAIQDNKALFQIGTENGKKVAIIGAGPAGISCACELRRMGFAVEIYEARKLPSGLTLHGVAPYKITNEAVLEEMAYLERQFGFNIHYESPIRDMKEFQNLTGNHDAIFLGVGLGNTRLLHIQGEALANCIGAVEFIEHLRFEMHKTSVGANVIVLGGGNTAMDAASEACRMGAEQVTLCYRRSMLEMPAYSFEYTLAKSAGTTGMFNVVPIEILGKHKVEGVRFARSETRAGQVTLLPNTEFTLACDMVIKATGQTKQAHFIQMIDGIELDQDKRIVVNEFGQTRNLKYFAGGDAVNGGREVVNAAAEGKAAALGIFNYLFPKVD
ncbi:MAG: FAD-dependent oxidoreductase [Candidatus Marinimicrobia bacterium]|nr:FAD-dependent oxidoreductase [Candidatus Neomarinimicrobiota bacterium]